MIAPSHSSTPAATRYRSRSCRNSTCKQHARRVATRCPTISPQGLIETWLRFKVQETSVAIMTGALEIKAQHGLSYWDAAIVAAARALGCRELYSEDMTHGREIDGVTIIDPFR